MIGILLVFISFVLLRFLFGCPNQIWERLNSFSRNLFHYSQQIIYWGLLIIGLILCFTSSLQVGLITLGAFLWCYNFSIKQARWKRIPLIGNALAELLGKIILVVGLFWLFLISLKFGLYALGAVVLSFLITKSFLHFEIEVWKKQKPKSTP